MGECTCGCEIGDDLDADRRTAEARLDDERAFGQFRGGPSGTQVVGDEPQRQRRQPSCCNGAGECQLVHADCGTALAGAGVRQRGEVELRL